MNIYHGSDIAGESSIYSESRFGIYQNPPVLSVKSSKAIFITIVILLFKSCIILFQPIVTVVGMNVFYPSYSQFIFQVSPGKLQPCFVKEITKLVCTGSPDHDRCVIGHATEPLLSFRNDSLSLCVFGDIFNGQENQLLPMGSLNDPSCIQHHDFFTDIGKDVLYLKT